MLSIKTDNSSRSKKVWTLPSRVQNVCLASMSKPLDGAFLNTLSSSRRYSHRAGLSKQSFVLLSVYTVASVPLCLLYSMHASILSVISQWYSWNIFHDHYQPYSSTLHSIYLYMSLFCPLKVINHFYYSIPHACHIKSSLVCSQRKELKTLTLCAVSLVKRTGADLSFKAVAKTSWFLFIKGVLRVMCSKSALSHLCYNCLRGACCINDLQTRGWMALQKKQKKSAAMEGISPANHYLHAAWRAVWRTTEEGV